MEGLHHINTVRFRVIGSGNLQLTLRSLDNVRSTSLIAIVMESSTNREPTRLCNFIEQRTQLEIKTTAINETFTISKIIIFVKPFATEYPG